MSDTALQLVLAFIYTAGGGAAVFIVNQMRKLRVERSSERERREKGIVEHLENLVERQDRRISELTADNMRTCIESHNATMMVTAMKVHMRYLEDLLRSKGLRFNPFVEPPLMPVPVPPIPQLGSDEHKPLGGGS